MERAKILFLVFAFAGIAFAQTWIEMQILTASNKAFYDYFGWSVSLTDNYALVGAFGADPGGVISAGAAYVYVRSGTTWTEQAILTASNIAANNIFGSSVSLTDNYALVGAHGADPGGLGAAGAAYVFVRSGASWTQQAILTASNKAAYDSFGWSVSLTDNYALVGAAYANPGGINDAGAAYVFVRSGTTWTEQAILTASIKAAIDYFGEYVSLTNDNTALIGAYGSSRTYTFTRVSTTWTQSAISNTCCPQPVTQTANYKIEGDAGATVEEISSAGRAIVFLNSGPSRSRSRSRSQSHIPGDESSSMIPIIAGSCGGVVGLAAVFLYVRKKQIDKKKQSNAANFVETQPTNTKTYYGKDIMMSNFSLGPDTTPDNLGSMFMSKKPNATSAIDTMMSMKPNQAVFSDATTQESSSSNKSQSPAKQVSRFNDYSDISEVSFSQLEPIGSGAFGLLYRVELSMGVVAVKVPKSQVEFGSKEYNDMLSEAELLSKLRHTNITLLLGYGNHPSGSIIFLMEFADSSLADVLKSGPLQPDLLLEYAHGIVRGLLYLHIHSPPISHRDLKPENVLLVGGVAKLADFGLATARDFVSKTTGFAGTPIWSPPESFQGMFPGPPGDIYAFGLLLWSMMTGKTPYEGKQINEVLFLKVKNQVPDIPSTCPSSISKVMEQCWEMNPKHRITSPALEITFNDIRNL